VQHGELTKRRLLAELERRLIAGESIAKIRKYLEGGEGNVPITETRDRA